MSQDLITEMHGDIKVIKEQVHSLVKSVEAQAKRISPIEDDHKFRQRLYKLILGGGGLAGIGALLFEILR